MRQCQHDITPTGLIGRLQRPCQLISWETNRDGLPVPFTRTHRATSDNQGDNVGCLSGYGQVVMGWIIMETNLEAGL